MKLLRVSILVLTLFLPFISFGQGGTLGVITNLHGNFGLGFWLGSTNIYNREAEFRWNPVQKKAEYHDGIQWQLVGSGTGNGFPLTASVSAANFDITNINTLIANQIKDLDYIDFNLAQTNPLVQGRLYWDNNQDTLVLGLTDNVQGDVMQTMFAYVHNAESFTLTKGTVVYLYGATGDKASVKVASYSNDTTSARTMGLVSADIPAGSNGLIVTRGVIRKLNTNAYPPGSILWLGAYGNVQTNRPIAPNHGVFIGVVERSNPGNGFIYVQIQNGFELDELHNVLATNPKHNDLLFYRTNTSLWEARSLSNIVEEAQGVFEVDINGGLMPRVNLVSLPDPLWEYDGSGNIIPRVP